MRNPPSLPLWDATAALFVIGLALLLAACAPELEDRSFLVEAPRILAIQADPPEVRPGEPVTYRALLAVGGDAASLPEVEWAHCTLRKPLAELGPIHPGCLAGDGNGVERLGSGLSVQTEAPRQACRRYGPDLPEPTQDEPAGRPVDPDLSGGYYQPVIARTLGSEEAWVVGSVRLACGIPGATPSQLAEMARDYTPNANPQIAGLAMRRGDSPDWEPLHPHDPPAGSNVVAPGETIEIRAEWEACEDAPCPGAEPYLVFDPLQRAIVHAEEILRLSWYGTAGTFENARGEASGGSRSIRNVWTAPTEPGPVQLWLVLRDSRGGVGWQTYFLRVRSD